MPLFIFDPGFYDDSGLACDARLRFLHECLTDLHDSYNALGSTLALFHGDPRERIPALLADGYEVYVNADVTARYGRDRDADLLARENVSAFGDDGIVREGRSRESWDEQCEAYFTADPHLKPDGLAPTLLDSGVTIGDIESEYDISPTKRDVPTGGRQAAERRLKSFVDRIREYQRYVSDPAAAERNGSRLSAYLKFGVVSPREVYQRVHRAPKCTGRDAFISRLYWNRHYTQKLQDWRGWADRAVNPVYHGLYRSDHDPELFAAWKQGQTGFPMVDASMRALVETGFINFRMRAMCATFLTYVLREPWRLGADYYYYHLIDAAMGINHTQWQSQAGTVGLHPVRVYNPAKQVREHDPDGEFIRTYVPELAALPDEYLARPEKAPLAVLDDAAIDLGETYPYPVVDYEARAKAARDRFARLDDRAKEAIHADPEIKRRASLSSRRKRSWNETDESGTDAGQASLDEF
jgi:deoxyribodipyrimidine photo-lyase